MHKRIFALLLTAALLLFPVPARAETSVRLPIVMYHNISNDPRRWNDYVISASELESDLRTLRALGYETVSLRRLLAWQAGEDTLPPKPCMITFDDGCETVRTIAEPLLERYGFCAVAAVIGSVCEKFEPLDAHDPDTDNLSWTEVREMAERGTVEIACHTWAMHGLTPRKGCCRRRGEDPAAYRYTLSCDLARFLAAARKNAVALTGAIAYPYGAFDAETTRAVQDFGFSAAFTCAEQVNVLTGDAAQLYALGRFNRPHGADSENFFRKWEENR